MMIKEPSDAALQGYRQLVADERVQDAVKRLLEREYQPGSDLYQVFLDHSWAVAEAASKLARCMDADEVFVTEAAWLHDIGIKHTHAPGIHCHGEEHYLRHGIIGRRMCEEMGLPLHGLVCERHVGTGLSYQDIVDGGLPLPHRDMLCQSLEERLICYADKFFSKSGSGVLSLAEASRRIKRYGESSWGRFRAFEEEFGAFTFLPQQLP
jgi:uncharacterized protein